jgi:hypothetical protein
MLQSFLSRTALIFCSVSLAVLTVACDQDQQTTTTDESKQSLSTGSLAAIHSPRQRQQLLASPKSTPRESSPTQLSPLAMALDKAAGAKSISQSAVSVDDWNLVVSQLQDAIALMVGNKNPFNKGLTSSQVADIFQGKINNWSAVGGSAATIRVINRPAISGTHQGFKELVLKGANFGTTPNIRTLPRDATTPLIQALGTDGIGYATFAQVANQTKARVLSVDGLTPDAGSYPYQRSLYYIYKDPASAGVQAFLGYATSPQGQQALTVGN